MASAVQEALTIAQLYDYVSLIIVTAVVYDYILTLPKEIECIWNKPWTRLSTLFVLARYFGMCSVVLHAICNLTFMVGGWCFWIFICSADLVMILRLWALYARSRFILGTLLTLYAVEIIAYFVCYVTLDARFPRDPVMGTIRVLSSTSCTSNKVPQIWFDLPVISLLTLGGWMCFLIVVQYIKEWFRKNKLQWRFGLGRYEKLLMGEGLVYFIATLGFGLDVLLVAIRLVPADGWQALTAVIQQTLPFTLFPRVVLSLRKLYVRDLEGRRGSHIDSAFGFT